jgi:chromosome partitioning protein
VICVSSFGAKDLPKRSSSSRRLGSAPVTSDAAARTACALADLVLIPCKPQAFDLSAIETTADLVRPSGRQAWVVWVGGPPSAPVTYAAAGELVEALGLPIAPLRLPQRAVFHRASGSGRTAGELEPGGSAADDAALLAGWAFSIAGVSTRRLAAVSA